MRSDSYSPPLALSETVRSGPMLSRSRDTRRNRSLARMENSINIHSSLKQERDLGLCSGSSTLPLPSSEADECGNRASHDTSQDYFMTIQRDLEEIIQLQRRQLEHTVVSATAPAAPPPSGAVARQLAERSPEKEHASKPPLRSSFPALPLPAPQREATASTPLSPPTTPQQHTGLPRPLSDAHHDIDRAHLLSIVHAKAELDRQPPTAPTSSSPLFASGVAIAEETLSDAAAPPPPPSSSPIPVSVTEYQRFLLQLEHQQRQHREVLRRQRGSGRGGQRSPLPYQHQQQQRRGRSPPLALMRRASGSDDAEEVDDADDAGMAAVWGAGYRGKGTVPAPRREPTVRRTGDGSCQRTRPPSSTSPPPVSQDSGGTPRPLQSILQKGGGGGAGLERQQLRQHRTPRATPPPPSAAPQVGASGWSKSRRASAKRSLPPPPPRKVVTTQSREADDARVMSGRGSCHVDAAACSSPVEAFADALMQDAADGPAGAVSSTPPPVPSRRTTALTILQPIVLDTTDGVEQRHRHSYDDDGGHEDAADDGDDEMGGGRAGAADVQPAYDSAESTSTPTSQLSSPSRASARPDPAAQRSLKGQGSRRRRPSARVVVGAEESATAPLLTGMFATRRAGRRLKEEEPSSLTPEHGTGTPRSSRYRVSHHGHPDRRHHHHHQHMGYTKEGPSRGVDATPSTLTATGVNTTLTGGPSAMAAAAAAVVSHRRPPGAVEERANGPRERLLYGQRLARRGEKPTRGGGAPATAVATTVSSPLKHQHYVLPPAAVAMTTTTPAGNGAVKTAAIWREVQQMWAPAPVAAHPFTIPHRKSYTARALMTPPSSRDGGFACYGLHHHSFVVNSGISGGGSGGRDGVELPYTEIGKTEGVETAMKEEEEAAAASRRERSYGCPTAAPFPGSSMPQFLTDSLIGAALQGIIPQCRERQREVAREVKAGR